MAEGRWQPRVGARVRITADPKIADDVPPSGVWMVLSRAPEPQDWWLYATDDEARAWCAAHPMAHSSRCIPVPNRRLAPVGRIRI